MIRRLVLFALMAAPLLSPSAYANAEGEQLFKTMCKACHHLEMRLVGPALKDVDQRHSEDWLIKFIKSSQSVIASGDQTAIDLFNTYNKVPMPDQDLSDDQIRSILAYIKEAVDAVHEEALRAFERGERELAT